MNMRKSNWKTAGVLALAVAGTALAAPAQAQSTARVQLDGQPLATSVPPLVTNGRTMVPMRDIFEALNSTVVWEPTTREIRAQRDATRIWLQIGNRTARVNDDARMLDEAPRLYRGSTLVPLRFVSEALGADVNWDGSQRLVSISRPAPNYSASPQTPTAGQDVASSITIPAGAVVPVTLDTTLTSAEARVGDTFTATVKSDRAGDSEFPPGTKLRGRVTEVRPRTDTTPGVLDVEFTQALLPDGRTVAVYGDLISLDDDSITQQSDGRIMAKPGSGGTDLKIVGIGAAAGYILGRVLDQNSLITGILGAAGGYLYDRSRDKGKEQEAVVDAGSTLGVRLARTVSYTDAYNYYDQRQPYLG